MIRRQGAGLKQHYRMCERIAGCVRGRARLPPYEPHDGPANRCRSNMAHARQARPDFGLGFRTNVLFKGVP